MKKSLVFALLFGSLLAQANPFSPVQMVQIPKGEMPKVSLPPVENSRMFAGKTVAILTSHGVEESEITFPYQYLIQRGANVEILVPGWTAEGVVASRFLLPTLFVKATGTFAQGLTKRYDLIILTGGAWNAQVVRTDGDALKLITTHYQNRGPIAAICAGTVVLMNAGLTKGLTMTGSPPVRPDLTNSGANYVDQASVYDRGILTSRSPDDLVAFVQGIRRLLIGR